jgi:hypothetical protein
LVYTLHKAAKVMHNLLIRLVTLISTALILVWAAGSSPVMALSLPSNETDELNPLETPIPGNATNTMSGQSGAYTPTLTATLPFSTFLPLLMIPEPDWVKGNQGLQPGAVINDDGSINFTDETATQLRQAGAGWVRINFRLGHCYADWTTVGCNGVTALQSYDTIVNRALSKGIRVLGLLSNESWTGSLTHWNAGNAETGAGNGDNSFIQSFASQVAAVLARHFAGRVNTWEVWNEPNVTATYLYPSNFAWLLARVFIAVKQAGVRDAILVSGGINCVQNSSGSITASSSGANYLSSTYAQGKSLAGWNDIKSTYGAYPLDVIAQHIYIDGYGYTASSRIRSCLSYVRSAYVAYEGTATIKKTTITEVGWTTNIVSESVQANNLQVTYTTLSSISYVQNAYWFFLQDVPAAGLYFGLLRPNGTQKPSWSAYLDYADY